jgi:excisionase family DNA binding protein
MMEDRWFSVDEIADHLGIKRDNVCKWIGERQMPDHKIGRGRLPGLRMPARDEGKRKKRKGKE